MLPLLPEVPGAARLSESPLVTPSDVTSKDHQSPPASNAARSGDALDLLAEVDESLSRLFEEWRWHHGEAGGEDPETRDWHRGTIAKMILEEAAAWVAAVQDVTRVLRRTGHEELASGLARDEGRVIELVRRMDEASRGTVAEALRYSDEFHGAVESLADLWDNARLSQPEHLQRLAQELGDARSLLHSRTHLRKRAPLHPGHHDAWYERLPLIERVHAIYDRLRGLPDAMSRSSSDVQLTRRLRRGNSAK